MLHNSKLACIITNRQQRQQHENAKDIVKFREQYQQHSSQKKFDLKNTHSEEMMIPGLAGEDPKSKDRQQRQREQLRDWLIQQQAELAAQRHRQRMEEQDYNQFMVEVNNKALELQNLEMENRKATVIATMEYNRALSKEKRHQELEEDTLGLMEGAQTDVDTYQSTEENERRQMQELKEFQQKQIDEKKKQELSERNVERYYDCVRVDSARTAALIERQQAKLNKQMRKHLDSTNLQLAETRKQLQPDISRGAICESFFSQFNTCSR